MYSARVLSRSFKASGASSLFVKAPASVTAPRFFSATAVQRVTISESITDDHRELEKAKNNILNARDNDDAARWQNQFVWELARHSISEELVVYPAFEKYLEGGVEMAESDRREHRNIKEKLKRFQNLATNDPDFIPTLKNIWADLEHHIKDEENDDLPKLEKVLDPAESDSMTRSFERTKMFVPTRSHPSAPDRPPFETVMGLMAAPMDKLADMFRRFPKDDDKPTT